MKARISGRAAAFAVERADGWYVTRRGRPGSIRMGQADVNRVLGVTPDVITVTLKTEKDVEQRLEIEWKKDRALRLAIIALDSTENATGLDDVITLLEGLLGEPYVLQYVESQFYSQKLPKQADANRVTNSLPIFPRVEQFVHDLSTRQPTIEKVHDSFAALPDSIFGDGDAKAVFREQAISAGAFRTLVIASNVGAITDATLFTLHGALSSAHDARPIIKAWTTAFERISTRSDDVDDMVKFEDYDGDYDRDVEDFGGGPGGRQKLRNALEQQAAILERVADGDYDNARKFARELAAKQLADGGARYLAMSFTQLSQRAREMEAFELELEWAFLAVEHGPGDGRARTQYADALIQSDRVDEGLEEFERAAELGQSSYASNARARAMRKLGNYEEELRLFEVAATDFADVEQRVYSMVGIAQAKADLGDHAGALKQLQDTVADYPDESLVRLSLGTTYLRYGKYQEAWSEFEIATTLAKGAAPGANGLALVCRTTGNLVEARARYANTAGRFPRDIEAHIGLIDTLRALGERSAAIVYARRTSEKFPGSPQAAAKHAATVSESGRHGQASQLFKQAVLRFPKDVRLQASRAAAFRREGRLDKSLQIIDSSILRFPHNVRLKRTRADLLRRLDKLDEARRIYEDLVEEDPRDIKSRNGLAAILIIEGENSAVVNFIGTNEPLTADDWRSFMLVASALERRNEITESQKRLNWASERCPFAAERRLFASALAAYACRTGRARRAPRIEHIAERDIGSIIDFQVAAMTGQSRAVVAYSALTRNLPEKYAIIRDEIARNYNVPGVGGTPKKSKRWIGEAIERERLLAA
jgi:tetratricopeptide (TPR) repeat protein